MNKKEELVFQGLSKDQLMGWVVANGRLCFLGDVILEVNGYKIPPVVDGEELEKVKKCQLDSNNVVKGEHH